ncbi:hypothetical protein LCGC14_0464520 [marine sediment metagenome]|uniref:Uncharacterized protein n=1 Tax=marine sediment metagenome TaxID=412755 RepID=A0A0F9SE14_9ZZZZ
MGTVLKGAEPKRINLADGAYRGKIKSTIVNNVDGKEYQYFDIFIDVEGHDQELKAGYPTGEKGTVVPGTLLGNLIKRFTGNDVKADQQYDLDQIFEGKVVQFLASTNDDGYFNIDRKTLKPAEASSEAAVYIYQQPSNYGKQSFNAHPFE